MAQRPSRRSSETAHFFCVFCGAPYAQHRGKLWRCPVCKAQVAMERNDKECVVMIHVRGCGAAACCQRSPG